MGAKAAEADSRWYVLEISAIQYQGGRKTFADQTTGKILKDEDTVESYKIEEKGFVVCVVNKVNTILSPT